MAATRLIALHANKGKSIAQTLGERTDYARNPEKTEKGEFVTGYACDPKTVDQEFLLQKRMYQQIKGREPRHNVIAYQIRQSFKPGEITPEDANRIGRELALRFTKGQHSFIVATHTDRAHIHNHIIFNSTSMDGTRKFKNFWFSGLALQKVSDLVCLENGLSVIEPKRGPKQKYSMTYPRRETIREKICEDIDRVLQKEPATFEEFLREMRQMDYEIKYGKSISVKGKNQKSYIRLSSLAEGYTEAELRLLFINAPGQQAKRKKNHNRDEGRINLLIDIQSKLQEKGAGYKRWAGVYNLKQMSKTLLYLRDHHIDSIEQLQELTTEQINRRNELLETIRSSEKRLAEIGSLKKTIIDYSKTRTVYEAYRQSGYSKKFLEAHREEIEIHKAAKSAFDEMGTERIPKIKELSAEYAEVLARKKQAYQEYVQVKKDAKELLIAQKNIEMLYDADEENQKAKRRKKEKSR